MANKTYKILGLLLTYPSDEWHQNLDSMAAVLKQEKVLQGETLKHLLNVLKDWEKEDIYTLQESYVETFDRNRHHSLHLFEHVHGESRDRGQAMVDLIDTYNQHGFYVSSKELPDFVPLFLEFVSTLADDEANDFLRQPLHIIKQLGINLTKNGKPEYAAVMSALCQAVGEKLPDRVKIEILNETENLDQSWAEPEVRFMAAPSPETPSTQTGGCGSNCSCGGTK